MKFCFFTLLLLGHLAVFAQQKDSLSIKIGQMIMLGLPGNVIDTSHLIYTDIKSGKIGGITIYERHLTATNAAENLKALIEAYQNISPIPLLVAITQEGGQVNRLKQKYGFPAMPSAKYLGDLNNPDSTKWYADNTAYTLSRVGINVNFAPVLDVYLPQNPVLGSRKRTFSSDTKIIKEHAAQVIHSHNYFNVITAVKHFPGHGSSTKDTHLELTDVSKTWDKKELQPYRDLIKKGLVKAVMTAHVVNEQIDKSKLPATLSKKTLSNLLRKELKFDGVVFSDDMHMKAIAAEYSLKDAIAFAINAGVDILLFSGNSAEIRSGSDIVSLILQLVQEKRISERDIDASYKRIMKLKKDFKIIQK